MNRKRIDDVLLTDSLLIDTLYIIYFIPIYYQFLNSLYETGWRRAFIRNPFSVNILREYEGMKAFLSASYIEVTVFM